MGTYYKLYKEGLTGELGINEASNQLELLCWSSSEKDAEISFQTVMMEPEELLKLLLEGVKVCAYWMEEDAVLKEIEGVQF